MLRIQGLQFQVYYCVPFIFRMLTFVTSLFANSHVNFSEV